VATASGTGSTKEMRVESSSNLSRTEVDELKFNHDASPLVGDPTGLPVDNDDIDAQDMLTAEVEDGSDWDDEDWDDDDVDDLFFDEDDEDDATG